MDYEAAWECISNLLVEMRKSGEKIPMHVMNDLRAAKTMIEIYRVDQSNFEMLLRVEDCLAKIEAYLFPLVKKKLGDEYAKKWSDNLVETQRRTCKIKPPKKFPVGIPRDSKWIRIKPSEKISVKKIRHLSKQNELKTKIYADGYILVFGNDVKLKEFIKNMTELLHEDSKKQNIKKAAN